MSKVDSRVLISTYHALHAADITISGTRFLSTSCFSLKGSAHCGVSDWRTTPISVECSLDTFCSYWVPARLLYQLAPFSSDICSHDA